MTKTKIDKRALRWLVTVAILSCSLGALCGAGSQQARSAQDEKTLETWAKEFCTGNENSRRRAARVLVSAGTPGARILSTVLSNPYAEHWESCMEILVSQEPPPVPCLLELIQMESSPDLRHNPGVRGLEMLGERSLPALKKVLESRDETPRLCAVIAFRILLMNPSHPWREKALPILIAALRQDDSSDVRTIAAEALGSYSMMTGELPPRAIAALTDALADGNTKVRAQVTVTLSGIGKLADKSLLINALKTTEDETQRLMILSELRALGPCAEKAIPELTRLILESDSYTRREAAEVLGSVGANAVPTLVGLLGNEDPEIRIAAAKGLCWAGPANWTALPTLVRMLEEEQHVEARVAAVDALGYFPSETKTFLDRIIHLLDSATEDVSSSAIRCLGRLGEGAREAVPALLAKLEGLEGYRFDAVLLAIGGIGPSAVKAIPTLVNHFPNNPHSVGQSLARIGPASVPALVTALGSDNNEVRRQAAWALRDIGPSAHPAVEALIVTLRDEDTTVRNFSAQALGSIGEGARRAVPALLRQLADPDDNVRSWVLDSLAKLVVLSSPNSESMEATVWECRNDNPLAAGRILALIGSKEMAAQVFDALVQGQEFDAEEAARELGGMIRLPEAIRTRLEQNVASPEVSPNLRAACALALLELEDNSAGRGYFASLLASPDPRTQVWAISLVGSGSTLFKDRVSRALRRIRAGSDPYLAACSADLIVRREGMTPENRVFLLRFLNHCNPRVSYTAAMTLAHAGNFDAQVEMVLLGMLCSPDGSTRRAAVQSFSDGKAIPNALKRAVRKCLSDEDRRVRLAARRIAERH